MCLPKREILAHENDGEVHFNLLQRYLTLVQRGEYESRIHAEKMIVFSDAWQNDKSMLARCQMVLIS